MKTADRITIVESFLDRSKAEHAVEELLRNGFRAEQIGYVLSSGEDVQSFSPAHMKTVEGAKVGAAAGVALGGLVGAAIGAMVIPGAGAVIAGGVLAALLEGAAAGGAGGGLVGALIGMSVPEDDARVYERHFHSGHTLVTVRTDGRYDEATAILQQAQEWVEPKIHHGSRLAELVDGVTSSDGAGKAFVPQP